MDKSVAKDKKQKDISIELLRIYACLLVIFAHIQIGYMVGDEINSASLIIKCLIGDNVPIFLLILGFYMFNGVQGEDRIQKIPGAFLRKLKGFLIRIYIPTLIVTLIACFASDFIYKRCTFGQLFTQPNVNWEYLKNYVILQEPMDMVGQFWYIITYIKILVFFPLLAFLCVDQKGYNGIRRVYIGMSFLSIVFADIEFLKETTLLQLSDYVFDRHFLYVLLGFELALFFRKCKWSKKWQIVASAGVFLCGLGLRYGLTMYSFDLFGVASNDYFMVLECAPAYISSAGSLMLFYSVFRNCHNRIVQFIGGITFYVYMLHGMMIRYFSDIGEEIRVAADTGATNWQAVQYYMGYGVVVFILSALFGILIKEAYDGVCYLIGKGASKYKRIG